MAKSKDDAGDTPTAKVGKEETRAKQKGKKRKMSPFERTFRELLEHCKDWEDDGVSPQGSDAVANSLFAVLGSAPAYSVAETMISASQADGQMYQNAVAHQQKTNVVGMVATVSCVAQLLDMSRRHSWPETEEEEPGE